MKIELKAYRPSHLMSEETTAFTATIYVDGKHRGRVMNNGQGGPNRYAGDVQDVASFARSLPNRETEYGSLPNDLDLMVSDLIDKLEHARFLKRHTKTKVMFRLKEDSAGEWRNVAHRGERERAIAFVKNKYGKQLAEIH